MEKLLTRKFWYDLAVGLMPFILAWVIYYVMPNFLRGLL